MPNDTMRFHLRAQTNELHEELDALVGEWTDLGGYGHYARALLAFRAPVEAALATTLPAPFADWAAVSIADDLRADLAALHLDAPLQAAPPEISGASRTAGALYVLEGSGLGARILLRRVQALGLSAEYGARHLATQTADKARWPDFLTRLDDPSLDREQAVAGAKDAFALALAAFRAELIG